MHVTPWTLPSLLLTRNVDFWWAKCCMYGIVYNCIFAVVFVYTCTILHHMHPGRSSWNELHSGDNMFLSCKTWEVLCLYFWFQYQLGWDSMPWHFRTDISMVTSIAGLRLFPGLAWKKTAWFSRSNWILVLNSRKMFYKQVMMRWFGLNVQLNWSFEDECSNVL